MHRSEVAFVPLGRQKASFHVQFIYMYAYFFFPWITTLDIFIIMHLYSFDHVPFRGNSLGSWRLGPHFAIV